MHILPKKFLKIRHNGILSNRSKKKSLEQARKSLNAETPPKKDKDWKSILSKKYNIDFDICHIVNLLCFHNSNCIACILSKYGKNIKVIYL